MSYSQMKKNLKEDWSGKLKKLNGVEKIIHLVILPTYKEEEGVITETLDSILKSNYSLKKIILTLAIEERAGKEAKEMAQKIKDKYKDNFHHFLITVHPKDIPGEIAGKGSNGAWAVKETRKQIIDNLGIPYENVLVSSFDIDTKVYPDYFSCLSWHYLTSPNPTQKSYQPVPVYNNNVWHAPAFSRVVSTSNTFWQMVQQQRTEKLVTYSSHAMPLESLAKVGYPSNIVSDDSRIFWKAYFYYDGNYEVVPLYYPVSMDAVMAKTFLKTAINQYKQQRRWAWGCVEIPYLIYCFTKNKKIPLWDKIKHSVSVIDGFWSWATAALLIFCLGWLPIIMGGEAFNVTVLSYNLPRLTGSIMTLALIGMFVSATLSMFLIPPRPKNVSRFKRFSFLLQWFLLPVNLILFGSFPAIEAQIRLMLGKYMGFWVTEKVRKE